MATEVDPVLGNWYQHLGKGQKFCVVARDDSEGSIEIQYFDGGVEEVSQDGWFELDVEMVEAPEDWSGPIDIAETDDLGTQITDTSAEDWCAAQQEIRVEVADAGRSAVEDVWEEDRSSEEPWDDEL